MVTSVSTSSAASSALAYDNSDSNPLKKIRSEFRGYDSDFKPSVQEQIEMVPIVQYYKKNLRELASQQEAKQKKIEAYEELKSYASKFYEACNVLRKPEDDVNNAFLQKSASVSSSEGTGTDFVDVAASYGAASCSFELSVKKLASSNSLRFGTEDLTNVTDANDIIQNVANDTIDKIITDFNVMNIPKDSAGLPKNPLVRELFMLVKSYKDSPRDPDGNTNLGLLKTEAQNLYTQISNASKITMGFASLQSEAVDDGTNSLDPGDYYFYAFAGGIEAAKNLLQVFTNHGAYANPQEVLDEISTYINSFEGTEIKNNPMLKIMQEAATEAAKTATNDLPGAADIVNAVDIAYTEYKEKCKVTLVANDSLETVIAKINTTSPYSLVNADYIVTSPGSYLLEISSQKTGLDYQIEVYDNADSDNKESLSNIQEERFASNAEVLIDGYFVSSNSNNIQYAENISVNLKKANHLGESETITISNNNAVLQLCINNFVEAFNSFQEFIAKQTERDPTTYTLKDTAILGNDGVLRDISSQLLNFPLRSLDYPDGYKSLADIGISLTSNKKGSGSLEYIVLDLDEEKLKEAITTNFDQVSRIFEFNFESSDPRVNIIGHEGVYYGISSIKFFGHKDRDINDINGNQHNVQIDILNPDGSVKKQEFYDTSFGNLITCPQTSLLAGMTFSFSEDVVDNVLITPKQGIADQLFGFISRYTDDPLKARIGLISDTENDVVINTSDLVTQIRSLEAKLREEENSQAQRIASYMERSAAAKIKANYLEMYLDALSAK